MFPHNSNLFFISDASPRVRFLTLPGLFLQATHDRRSQLFQLLLLEHLKLKNEFVAAESESMQREERHAAQVNRLQEQLDRRVQLFDVLKKDLDAATEAKSKSDKQLETARNALKERALHDQELKTKCDEDNAKREKAESELAELQSRRTGWFDQLKLINRQMSRKLPRVAYPSSFLESYPSY